MQRPAMHPGPAPHFPYNPFALIKPKEYHLYHSPWEFTILGAFPTAPSPQTPYNAASGGAPGSGTGTPLPLISYNSLNGVLTFPTPDLGGNAHGARSA